MVALPAQIIPAAPQETAPKNVHQVSSLAELIANTVITMEPVSAGVLRAVRVADALENYGAVLRRHCGSRHTLSYPTTTIRTFWSHSWHGGAWKKYVTLLLFYHGTAALLIASLGAGLASVLFGLEILPALSQPKEGDSNFQCIWTNPVGLVSYCVVLLFWRSSADVFLDVICIDQEVQPRKADGLLSIGAFLKKSDTMLVLWDHTYCDRLWCMFEIAGFARSRCAGEEPRLLIRPTELSLCYFSQALTVLFVTIVTDFLPLSGDDVGVIWTFQALNALVFCAGFYANIAIYRDCFRSMEADGDKLASFSLDNVSSFCCENNHERSRGLCDRRVTNKCIIAWFGSKELFEEYVRTRVRALLLREHAKQCFSYRQAITAMVPVLWHFVSKAAAWSRFTTWDPKMQAARELIRGLAWWLGVAPMALLVGTRLCYPLRHRRSWAPAEYLINLPPLLASVMVVVAAQQLEHLCFLLDDLFELPGDHGLVPYVLIFAAMVLPATVGLCVCLGANLIRYAQGQKFGV